MPRETTRIWSSISVHSSKMIIAGDRSNGWGLRRLGASEVARPAGPVTRRGLRSLSAPSSTSMSASTCGIITSESNTFNHAGCWRHRELPQQLVNSELC